MRGAGKDVDVVFFDEWGFFSPAVLPAILPTLANGSVAVMTTSVPPDPDSPMMQLINVKYKDGTPVVKKLDWLQSCTECKRRGEAESCTHRAKPPQHFQSYGGQERLERLMSVNPESYDREMLNKGGTPSIENAFPSAWIDAMVAHRVRLKKTIHHLFITIDPSAGVLRRLCCAGCGASRRDSLSSLYLFPPRPAPPN